MHLLCTSLIALSMGSLQADQPEVASDDFFSNFPSETNSFSSETSTSDISPQALSVATTAKKEKPKGPFKAFTGKVKGKKVRLRTQPDLDSSIVTELQKGEYIAIIDEIDDFYVTEAPENLKAYVFRSFVLDNVVEGNRVNVRLYPNMDAPVILHLNSGDTINGAICETNHKWIEINAPKSSRFYVSKNYIENAGNLDVKAAYDTRLNLVKTQLSAAENFSESEMKKNYNEIDFDRMNQGFQVVIQEYADFPQFVEKAKDLLSQLQEKFIDKRISYMESRVEVEENIAASMNDVQEKSSPTDKMKLWEPVEEAIFLSWASVHESREQSDYQLEQKLASQRITGILEPYSAPVKCKPGDFVVRQNDLPVGYVYSTVVNLQNLVGKKVSLVGTPRPNNNFAFPAYFIVGVEE